MQRPTGRGPTRSGPNGSAPNGSGPAGVWPTGRRPAERRPPGVAPSGGGPSGRAPAAAIGAAAGLTLADFDYHLPAERIAQQPARPRDAARLLHLHADGLSDRAIRELPGLLRRGDVVVANDTRVFPAQLLARRGAARIGLTLDRPRPDGAWQALARNARRLRPGDTLAIERGAGLTARVVDKAADGSLGLAFNQHGAALMAAFAAAGALALPPYIERPHGPTAADATDYQTVFARMAEAGIASPGAADAGTVSAGMADAGAAGAAVGGAGATDAAVAGAVAAPTAGLHFTPSLLAALRAAGVTWVNLTLHVGIGSFLPVRAEPVAEHRMHAERGEITAAAAATINQARAAGGRVVAVGTTSLRLLESAARPDGAVAAFRGETALFILPGYRFKTVDRLLTNFHLPRSTLLMLVAAFVGRERILAAYAHAIAAGYRFHSYGDACLLERP